MREARLAGDVGHRLQARGAHLHHVFERRVLAHHAVVGGSRKQGQQDEHESRGQQQFLADPQFVQHGSHS